MIRYNMVKISGPTIFFQKLFPIALLSISALLAIYFLLPDSHWTTYICISIAILTVLICFKLINNQPVSEVFDGGDFLVIKSKEKDEKIYLNSITSINYSRIQFDERLAICHRTKYNQIKEFSFNLTPSSSLKRHPFYHELLQRVARAKNTENKSC